MMSATAPTNFLILLFVQAIAGKCTTPNNEGADCVSIYKCPILLNALATNPSASKEFIKLSNCGGTSGEPLVCCGSSSSLNASENNAPSKGKCTTPNNEDADCVSIYQCPILLNALATNSSASKEFVKLSNCGGKPAEPLVCCGSSSSLNAPSKGKCTTPNKEDADCVSIYQCPILLNALAANSIASKEFVKMSNCGGTSGEPLVCCGSLSSLNASEDNDPSRGKCTSPNNEDADCVSIYHCPVLLNALATNSSASKEFVKLSNCGGTSGEPLVCCGSLSSFNALGNNAPSKTKCTTPNDEEADCVPINRCPVIRKALRRLELSVTQAEFLGLSKCGSTSGGPLVCCGSFSNFNASGNNAPSKTKCTTPNNEEAVCVPISYCPVIINAFRRPKPSVTQAEFLKLSKCGGTSEEPLVCCGSASSFNGSDDNVPWKTKCTTPNNEEANCVPISRCPVIANALKSTELTATQEAFIRLSECGDPSRPRGPHVCCGSLSRFNTTNNNSPSNHEKVYMERLLAHRRYCGYQHFDDYYHAGNSTGLDEFPWLALLLFKDVNDNTAATNIRCSGSLLGQKYVLTSAHCVTHARYNLTAVRFGEYNLDKSEDCIEGYPEECSDPTEDFDVEKVIPHPGYTNYPRILNDIALIRLKRPVEYSDYIRPICLPVPEIKHAEIDDVLTTSGWDRTADGTLTSIKKRVSIRLIRNDICEEKYRANQQIPKSIKEEHFCTVGVNDLSCVGDIGAPVMFSNRYQWHLEGINSFGKIPCDPGFPNVNTKIVYYLDWIEGNILP